jgi:hypothetical protein
VWFTYGTPVYRGSKPRVDESGAIVGEVFEKPGREPLAGATVVVEPNPSGSKAFEITGETGRYRIVALRGTYRVIAYFDREVIQLGDIVVP